MMIIIIIAVSIVTGNPCNIQRPRSTANVWMRGITIVTEILWLFNSGSPSMFGIGFQSLLGVMNDDGT